MRVSRIQFDDSEPTESIVSRIACAFDPGNILKVRGNFFKMSPQRVMNQTIADNVVGDNYTLILNPGEPIPEGLVKAPPPPPPVVQDPEPDEEADWDDEEPVEAVEDPNPIIQEPITVLADPEPLAVPESPQGDLPESSVSAQVSIDFGRLAALPPDLPSQDLAEAEPTAEVPDSVPPPPTSEVFISKPSPSIDGKPLTVDDSDTPTSKSGEYRIEIPRSRVSVEPGQIWQSKDTRRKTPPFVVKSVDSEFVYQDNGRKISIDRMFRYNRVS